MEVVRGQIVFSRQGRDAGKAYVAAGKQAERLLLCDGAKWTLNAPKRKNPLHIAPTKAVLPEEELKTDLEIKRALKLYLKAHGPEQQGG